MNQASGAVTPLDPEMVQAGDAVGQRPERRGLAEGAVGPVGVAEVLVLAQDGHQVPLIPDQGPVQQLPPATADARSGHVSREWARGRSRRTTES